MPIAPPKNIVVEIIKPKPYDDPNNHVVFDFDDEDVKPAVDKLAPLCDEFRKHSFQRNYAIGEIVLEQYDALRDQRPDMYGQRFFNRLAQDLNRPKVDGQLLSQCYNLVRNIGEDEYLELSECDSISPTHVLMLGGIAERKVRDEFRDMIVDEELTTEQLFKTMKAVFGVKRKPGGGRPPKTPKNLDRAFVHLTTQIGKFIVLNDKAWFSDTFDIIQEIEELPAGKLTEEFREQIVNAAAKCDELVATATRDAEALRNTLPEFDRRAEAQAIVAAQAEENEREFNAEASA